MVSKIRLYTERMKIKPSVRQGNKEVFKVYLLQKDSIWRLCQDRLGFQLNGIHTSNNIEEEWDNIKHIIIQAVKEGSRCQEEVSKTIGFENVD